jgi:hypothetical protein
MALEGASARRHGKAGESYMGRIISAVERHPFWLFRSKGSRSHAAIGICIIQKDAAALRAEK